MAGTKGKSGGLRVGAKRPRLNLENPVPISLKIEEKTDKLLCRHYKEVKRNKSEIVNQAIAEFLERQNG